MKQVDLKHMRKISIIWGIIMFLLIIGVTAIGIIYKSETKNYKKFETELANKAKDYIIDHSYEETYGARPIKRYVTHNIETLIADKIIRDEIKYGETITVDVNSDKLVLN